MTDPYQLSVAQDGVVLATLELTGVEHDRATEGYVRVVIGERASQHTVTGGFATFVRRFEADGVAGFHQSSLGLALVRDGEGCSFAIEPRAPTGWTVPRDPAELREGFAVVTRLGAPTLARVLGWCVRIEQAVIPAWHRDAAEQAALDALGRRWP